MSIEEETGDLFGSLWPGLSDEQYQQAVELFTKRAQSNSFDLDWLVGKRILDAGTGSGRYSVAMAVHGAAEIQAIDISESGLAEARHRARYFPNIVFKHGSVLDIPFPDDHFDLVWCAGVIHHTTDLRRALAEVSRTCKETDGKLFLLLYGTGGLRWKLIKSLRPIVRDLGRDYLSQAMEHCGLPMNNRKHFMDDFFVPIQKLTSMPELREILHEFGFRSIERWTGETYDHESNLHTQLEDMEKCLVIANSCQSIAESQEQRSLATVMRTIAEGYCIEGHSIADRQSVTESEKQHLILGEGLLRVVASNKSS